VLIFLTAGNVKDNFKMTSTQIQLYFLQSGSTVSKWVMMMTLPLFLSMTMMALPFFLND